MELWLEAAINIGASCAVALFLLWPSRKRGFVPKHSAPKPLILDLNATQLMTCSEPMSLWFPQNETPTHVDVVTLFHPRFPDLTLDALKHPIKTSFYPALKEDTGRLDINPTKAGVEVALHDDLSANVDRHKLRMDAQAKHSYANLLNAAPYPIWRVSDRKRVSFGNTAFKHLTGDNPEQIEQILSAEFPTTPHPTRLKITDEDRQKATWFDVTSVEEDSSTLHFAVDVSPVVTAENAQRNFVQTLTKTFAQLSIGLAIFDKNRQLVLFNPALVDLTELPAEFLSARPNLLSVFDKLRDNRIMPEPKDYAHWREKLAVLVAASAEGTYTEIWNLPSGSTYRVSGRPHPDGAIAFLFEDITAEISLTRKFRSELDLVHSIFDTLDTAIAVFSTSGQMVLCNDAYGALWGYVDETSLQMHDILDASKHWQSQSLPSPIWGDVREFVMSLENRVEWDADLYHTSGRKLNCRVTPIGGSSTLVIFSDLWSQMIPAAATNREVSEII